MLDPQRSDPQVLWWHHSCAAPRTPSASEPCVARHHTAVWGGPGKSAAPCVLFHSAQCRIGKLQHLVFYFTLHIVQQGGFETPCVLFHTAQSTTGRLWDTLCSISHCTKYNREALRHLVFYFTLHKVQQGGFETPCVLFHTAHSTTGRLWDTLCSISHCT